MNDLSPGDRKRDLEAFANAGAQQNQPEHPAERPPSGHALVRPTTGLAERVIGAQPVAVYRDEAKVLQKLSSLAAAAGTDWFYRFPVRNNQTGQTDWIEGPSIKLANDVARIFGNNVNEVREIDVGDAWIFYARFTDIETGFSMERAYRQRKSQRSMRTKDADRQLDIAYQIGQSKAIRNCIVNSLQIYADYAFEQAQNSLVNKIGKDLDGWRTRTVEGLAKMPVEIKRVERVVGRAAKDWLAPNVAQVIAMMKSVADGMASADEVFPPLEDSSPASTAASSEVGGAREGGGAQAADSEAADDSAASQSHSTASTEKSEPAAAADPNALSIAYQRGREAKAAGHQRRALPPEYRDPAHTKEQVCWQAGYDGAPMPTFKGEA